jgi:hypothetical protein
MNTITARIQSTLRDANVALQDRARMTELLTAEAVANCLSIPSSPVENGTGFYISQHKVNVLEKLSAVNEHIVVDIDQAETLVLQLWLTRYRMVHQATDQRISRLMRIAIREGNYSIPKIYTEMAATYPDTEIRRYHTDDEKDLV